MSIGWVTLRFVFATGVSAMVVALAHFMSEGFQVFLSANNRSDALGQWFADALRSDVGFLARAPQIALAGWVGWALPRWALTPWRNIRSLAPHILHAIAVFIVFDVAVFLVAQTGASALTDVSAQTWGAVCAQAMMTGIAWGLCYWGTRSWQDHAHGRAT